MGNTPEQGSSQTIQRWGNIPQLPAERPQGLREKFQISQDQSVHEKRNDNARSKSVNADSSFHRLVSVNASVHHKTKDQRELKVAELQKSSAFCNKFLTSCLEVKMNANLNKISSFLSLEEQESNQDSHRRYD